MTAGEHEDTDLGGERKREEEERREDAEGCK